MVEQKQYSAAPRSQSSVVQSYDRGPDEDANVTLVLRCRPRTLLVGMFLRAVQPNTASLHHIPSIRAACKVPRAFLLWRFGFTLCKQKRKYSCLYLDPSFSSAQLSAAISFQQVLQGCVRRQSLLHPLRCVAFPRTHILLDPDIFFLRMYDMQDPPPTYAEPGNKQLSHLQSAPKTGADLTWRTRFHLSFYQ